ncbi:MAG TPA: universal stress protein [Steroidobacteraceae bacterium]|nr:universal stress protein [Steroidobacteraceae bacterium]
MYKRILLAYDGTLAGRVALREGALLAKQCHAQVFLLSVVAESPGARLAEGAGGVGVSHLDHSYRDILDDGIARLQRLGFDPQAHLAVGEPAREIGAYAERIAADLVVVGHSRQNALTRWWSGPSGAHLIDFIRCSMLISRNPISDEEFAAAFARLNTAGTASAAPPPPLPPDQTTAVPEGASRMSPRRRRVRLLLLLVLPLALLVAALWYVLGGSWVSIDDATVEADKVGVSTDVAGIVRAVRVHENQHVAAGQVLLELDDRPFRYALERAEAQVATVRDQLGALKASYRDMQAQIEEATQDQEYFRTEYRRQEDLLKVQVASQTARDAARRNLENAGQHLVSLKQQLAAIAANLDERPDAAVESYPHYHDALAQRDEAARELEHTVVRAAFAGLVTDVPETTPGRYLGAAVTAFYLVATDHVWVQANPKETEITYVRPNQPTRVHVDIYPGIEWRGSVESISPAVAQEFSLLPAQNTSGNWVKVVQRVPLRIRLETSAQGLPPLAAGLSAEIEVDTGHARGLPGFLRFGHARQGAP